MRQGSTQSSPNERLRHARELRGWSQQRVAEAIGTNKVMVSRWEGGVMTPSPHYRAQLCALFGQTAEELGFIPASDSSESRVVEVVLRPWHVPFPRNLHFTGREETLARLRDALNPARRTPPVQALCGLAGVGKTQTALEYTYRFRDRYQAVLWVRADSRDLLLAELANLAPLLDLPPFDSTDQTQTARAVLHWLQTHPGWLLVLDNVEDPTLPEQILPTAHDGQALLTMRSSITGGGAPPITLESMTQDDGALLLLRRAKVLAPQTPLADAAEALQAVALRIATALGGLPLALDQAGAYVEETGRSLDDYLALYGTQRARLLDRRGMAGHAHPPSVAATLALAVEQAQASAPAAADLLRVCALLHPDAIPEELFGRGAAEMGLMLGPTATDTLALDEVVAILRRLALLRRDPANQTLWMHRLVQAVLLDAMDEVERHRWVERAVRSMNIAFPDSADEANWARCQRLALHAQVCATHIATLQLMSPEAGSLLSKLGAYWVTQGQYAEAEALLCQASTILGSTVGEHHPDSATCLNDLAVLYQYRGRYAEAEPLCRRALAIRQELFDGSHPAIWESVHNLGSLLMSQGKYAQAAAQFERATTLGETLWGATHRNLARVLHNRGALYARQGRFVEAVALLQRALSIWRADLGEAHRATLGTTSQLAIAYGKQGEFAQAVALHQKTLAERERQLGPAHFEVAESLHYLAWLAHEQRQYAQAKPLYQRALAIREQTLGPRHPCTLQTRHQLARLALACGQDEEAEELACAVLRLRQETVGVAHLEVAESLDLLLEISRKRGGTAAAKRQASRAQTIRAKTAVSSFGGIYSARQDASVRERLVDEQATVDKP